MAHIPRPLILAIDQGTHASRALVVDRRGAIVAQGAKDIAIAHPQPDWAEQDGEEVVASIFDAVGRAVSALGARRADLAAAGLAAMHARARAEPIAVVQHSGYSDRIAGS